MHTNCQVLLASFPYVVSANADQWRIRGKFPCLASGSLKTNSAWWSCVVLQQIGRNLLRVGTMQRLLLIPSQWHLCRFVWPNKLKGDSTEIQNLMHASTEVVPHALMHKANPLIYFLLNSFFSECVWVHKIFNFLMEQKSVTHFSLFIIFVISVVVALGDKEWKDRHYAHAAILWLSWQYF